MIYIFILKFQITKNWVPSIFFVKTAKNAEFAEKPRKSRKRYSTKNFNLDFRDQGKKLN